jgi:hypothetical protein
VKARRQEMAARIQKVFLPGRSYSPPGCQDPDRSLCVCSRPGGMDLFLNGA